MRSGTLPLSASARLALKWPNDVLIDDGKLAGILIETAWNTPQATAVVIGIGINLHGAAELAAQVDEANRLGSGNLPAPGNRRRRCRARGRTPISPIRSPRC